MKWVLMCVVLCVSVASAQEMPPLTPVPDPISTPGVPYQPSPICDQLRQQGILLRAELIQIGIDRDFWLMRKQQIEADLQAAVNLQIQYLQAGEPVPPGVTIFIQVMIEWLAQIERDIQRLNRRSDEVIAAIPALLAQYQLCGCGQ